MRRPVQQTPSDVAHLLAIRGLTFVAQDGERLGRFLALSGVGPADIRARAADPAFLGGVLDYILGDDAMVIAFAEWAEVSPESVAKARHILPGAPIED
jgi:hypothetical protein